MGMQQLIANIAATVIVSSILLMLFSVQLRGQQASIDAIQYRASKKAVMSLVEMLEHDLKNVASNLDSNHVSYSMPLTSAILWPDTTVVSGDTTYGFEFQAQTDPALPPQTVRYEWKKVKDVTLKDGKVIPIHDVHRTVNGVMSGMSINVLTSINFVFRPDTTVNPLLVNPEDIRLVEVSITSVSPLGKGDFVEQTRWNAVLRPVSMTREDW